MEINRLRTGVIQVANQNQAIPAQEQFFQHARVTAPLFSFGT